MSSGTFQGFLTGSGIGTVPGLTLGTLTGTLVGGVTTLVTGGLGGAVGAGVGAVHGPFFKLGDVVGGALNKWLPTIPGWQATDEQKYSLEKMLGQIKDQDQPSAEELQKLTQYSSKSQKALKASSNGTASAKENHPPTRNGSSVTDKEEQAHAKTTKGSPAKQRQPHDKQIQNDSTTKQTPRSQTSVQSPANSEQPRRSKTKPKKLEIRSTA